MKKILLSRGEVALVDDEDYGFLSRYTWHCHIQPNSETKYAVARMWINGRRTNVQMHRMIMSHTKEHTDHVDRNGLNNQRFNIRPASRIENGRNRKLQKHSAKYKGVHFFKATGAWTASIRINTVKKHLGYFHTPEAAALAYDAAALKYFGEFARTDHQMGAL